MSEAQRPPISEQLAQATRPDILNKDSAYLSSLREAGFSMREMRSTIGTINAVAYKKEGAEGGHTGVKDNLLLMYAVQGDAGGTTHISTSFLKELEGGVDTVMGFNSALSKSSLEAGKYNHDLQHHADQMVELYKESIPEDEKDNPIVLVGHSMGGTTAPIVASKLLEQGYNVRDIIMIAPPGLVDRSKTKMATDFLKLGNSEHIEPDLPTLYPSPADIAVFADRFKELKDKKGSKPLTREETEELAYYDLAIQRFTEPDKLLLTNMSEDERVRVQRIDEEMQYLLDTPTSESQTQTDRLQAERTKILLKTTKNIISGNIEGQPTQATPRGGRVLRNLVRSGREITKTVGDLARETTVDVVQDVIDLNNTLPEHHLNITIISGDNDPVVGGYEVGEVNRVHVGPHTVYSEIGLNNFDHFTLPDDPVRVAHMVKRITEYDQSKTDRLKVR